VPEDGDFRQTIMDEAHNSAYSIHPVSTKMYMDLKKKVLVEWNESGHCPVRHSL
jgi:hypothetical protein